MATRHDYFYEFQRSGPNPHAAKTHARLEATGLAIEAEERTALERNLTAMLVLGPGVVALALLTWGIAAQFGHGWAAAAECFALASLGACACFLVSRLRPGIRERHERGQRHVANEFEWLESTKPEEWWSNLCEGREQHVGRWRKHWHEFRQGRGGFDLYLRDHCRSEGLSWKEIRPKLAADFRDFFQFIQLERRELELNIDGKTETHVLALRYWLERRLEEDQAGGRPTSLREARAQRVDEIFRTRTAADPDVTRFLASRASDDKDEVAS